MSTILMELHGKEKIEAPKGFEFYYFAALPEGGPTRVIKMIGGVPPLTIGGVDRGRPDRSKVLMGSTREVFLPVSEHAQWVKEWGKRTGLCPICQGAGTVPCGWNLNEGRKIKLCAVCTGSGKTLKNKKGSTHGNE